MTLRTRLALLLCLASAAVVPASHAQIAVYAMGSGGFLGSGPSLPEPTFSPSIDNNGFSAYGFTIGVYDDFARLGPVHLGTDVRYFQDNSGSTHGFPNKLHGVTTGLRLDLHVPVLPFKPYIQAEVGGVGTNYGVQSGESGSFGYQIQGGLDFTVFPHVDLRAEYGGGQIGAYGGNGQESLQEAGLGAVVRF